MSPELNEKLKGLKAIVFDCDGVLTNGQIFYNGNGNWVRFFNIKDGMGIKRLQKHGIKVGIITASNTEDIRERAKTLGIEDLYEGVKDKVACFNELSSKWGLYHKEIAYMGDDYQDVPVFQVAGLSVSVPNAIQAVQNEVELVTVESGGMGAVREICELILKAQGRT